MSLGTQSSEMLKPTAVLWHEAILGRKKEDIISALHKFFLNCRDAKLVTVWLDNCFAQNKNRTDFTEFEYVEPGHTFMLVNNFHHQVEKSLKKEGWKSL